MSSIKLTYFNFPGRAEVARLALTLGSVPFEDNRIAREKWMELKSTLPMGQLPVLEVDGQVLCQSAAIDRFCVSKAGLLPADAWKAAQSDQLYGCVMDVVDLVYKTYSLPDDEKLVARKALADGKMKDLLNKIGALLDKVPEGEFVAGPQPSHGDLLLYATLSMSKSGMWDGIPTDYVSQFPTLSAYISRIASLEPIKAYLAKQELPVYKAFAA